MKTTKEMKAMIETAFTESDAKQMLQSWKIFGSITEKQADKGKKLIKQNF